MTLQVRRMITTQQKMMQLVRYITMAGTVIGDPAISNQIKRTVMMVVGGSDGLFKTF